MSEEKYEIVNLLVISSHWMFMYVQMKKTVWLSQNEIVELFNKDKKIIIDQNKIYHLGHSIKDLGKNSFLLVN